MFPDFICNLLNGSLCECFGVFCALGVRALYYQVVFGVIGVVFSDYIDLFLQLISGEVESDAFALRDNDILQFQL